MRRLLQPALAFLALSACATTPSPAATEEQHTYVCPGGKTYSVRYDEGFTFAYVTTASASYRLPAKMSASGARYSDGRIEFWEKGPEAMLNGAPGGDLHGCMEQDMK